MWAVCPPSYPDNDMPIDLRKKVVLQRELDERREVDYSPRDRWLVDDKPQDLRPAIRGTLETAIKKLHVNGKSKQSQDEARCRSTDAPSEGSGAAKRLPRSSSCPDLTTVEQPLPTDLRRSADAAIPSEIKTYEYDGYSPEREDVHSPAVGGARKRKSFVPLYGDRAPVYERLYRSPSPQNLAFGYRSPSPKRPAYGYRSPSPDNHAYRSPSPGRPIVVDRHYYSPRPTYEEGRYRSPSPRPLYLERRFRSPSPKRRPESPSEYFSHPEVLLRRQLSQQSTSPYFLHVYDYYQHLVQRLREHSSPTVRISSPISPPMEEDGQRKRPCRALTGKHVRQGTGASLSTLLTLRQKIEERQKAKEHQPRNPLHKKNNPKKVKLNVKSALSKIQNC